MKTQKLIIGVAAILLTAANLSIVNYNVPAHAVASSPNHGAKVTLLAPVMVYPSAADRRAAALLIDGNPTAGSPVASFASIVAPVHSQAFNAIGSQLSMPYYSFGNQFGRITKE